MKAYLAGPLFSKMEIKQRKEEAKILRKYFKEKLDVFSPIEADFNEVEDVTSIQIYEGDRDVINKSNVFVLDFNNITDCGTFLELGMAIQRKEQGEDILIVGMLWDLRMSRISQDECSYEQNWGFNKFVIGAIKTNGYLVHDIEEAIPLIEKFINKQN